MLLGSLKSVLTKLNLFYLTISTLHTQAKMSRHLYGHRHIHIRTYIPMVHQQPYTYVYTHTYIHTHIHVLTQTHVSTHMHIDIAKSVYYHTSVNSVTRE